MKTKQTVAIIGAKENMGSVLAKKLSKENYRILLHSSKTNEVKPLLDEIKSNSTSADIEIVDDYVEISWEADIVVLAVSYTTEKEIAENIRSVVNQKVIISISNPLNGHGLPQQNISAAEELQKQLPNAKVISACNMVLVNDFFNPAVHDQKPDCFIAGNDEDALKLVYDLVKAAAFHPVIAGDLSMSRTLESMQRLLIQLTTQNNYKGITGWKILHN